ncbi:MAG: hypothetical protein ACI9MU_003045 [Alphaproteobacteria bacterium]
MFFRMRSRTLAGFPGVATVRGVADVPGEVDCAYAACGVVITITMAIAAAVPNGPGMKYLGMSNFLTCIPYNPLLYKWVRLPLTMMVSIS